jgi:DNA-binding MarR family transcriptional regulator
MGSKTEHKDRSETPDLRELQLLAEVERLPKINQRDLSKRLGIALGMTNILLHNLVQKGYVRITEAGWRRWIYNLTPDGITRKFNLTLAYINQFFDQYGKIRETLRNELALHPLNAESRVAMYGNGEFAELVYLGLREMGIEEIDVFNRLNGTETKFLGKPVINLGSLDSTDYDRVVIATMASADSLRKTVRDLSLPVEKVISFHVDLSSIFTELDTEGYEADDIPAEDIPKEA